MTLPSGREWLFSVKTFAASMLALYIALALGLPRPYWAMATVYVVSHPLTGATRSKGVYRAGGTLLGASAAVLLVPWLVNQPLLLSAVVSLWTGTLLVLSLLDRTPRNYLYMLAAYTLPMIAFAAVGSPAKVFDIAVARTEEILLAITCASTVAALVFPGRVAPVLNQRIGIWLRDAAAWATEALQPTQAPGASRHQLATDILALDQFIGQLAYDTASVDVVRHARELRWRLSLLLPMLSSLQSALAELRTLPSGLPAGLEQALAQITNWLQHPEAHAPNLPEAVLSGLDLQAPGGQAWHAVLAQHTLDRLHTLVGLWQDCLTLRQRITRDNHGSRGDDWRPAYVRAHLDSRARHVDVGMVAFAALSASALSFVLCLLWIFSGWQQGASAVIMGTITACFFAAQDEPARAQRGFFGWTCVGVLLTSVLLFYVIPATHDFETLMMTLALPFIPLGTLALRPSFAPMAMTLTVCTASFLGLSGAYDANFSDFVNSNLAGIIGAFSALVWTLLTRPFGTGMALRRLVRSLWRDLVRHASAPLEADHAALGDRMLDRLSLLLPRLAASAHDRVTDGFSELRVGFSVLDLQNSGSLEAPVGQPLRRVLNAVAAHYRARLNQVAQPDATQVIGRRIDRALSSLIGQTHPQAKQARNALAELRITLCPGRPPDALAELNPATVPERPAA